MKGMQLHATVLLQLQTQEIQLLLPQEAKGIYDLLYLQTQWVCNTFRQSKRMEMLFDFRRG